MKTFLNGRPLHANVTNIREQLRNESFWKKTPTKNIKKVMLEKMAEKPVDINDRNAIELVNKFGREPNKALPSFSIFTTIPDENESENSLWCDETLDF